MSPAGTAETGAKMADDQKRLRLFIYEFVLSFDRCPDLIELAKQAGRTLERRVEGSELTRGEGIVHFAVPAGDWWEDIGFT